ncbi:MAG: Trm112 family protein [Crenarchaeota archaeon]|nr:Trm112 family protein [Thermoproteota archaeon]
MMYMTLDVLACPYCKDEGFPLKLYVIEKTKVERDPPPRPKPYCELYCGYRGKFLKEMKEEPPCDECLKEEIVTGVLVCPKCGRWFPIIDGIPHMLPDELRNKEEDLNFLRKYKDKLPEEVLSGKPWGLKP